MKYAKGKFNIDYNEAAAVLYENGKYVRCFASDETKNGLSGFEKAKQYIKK